MSKTNYGLLMLSMSLVYVAGTFLCRRLLAHGIHQPCSQSGAVGPFPQAAGAASALNGFLMMVVAFGVGAWLGSQLNSTMLPLTNEVWFWSACISALSWTVVQRHGDAGRS